MVQALSWRKESADALNMLSVQGGVQLLNEKRFFLLSQNQQQMTSTLAPAWISIMQLPEYCSTEDVAKILPSAWEKVVCWSCVNLFSFHVGPGDRT